ncbi:high-affinity branched-chain amino acid ABC transporter permease LivM [Desulfovibrio litoralis]|uniref:Branched-chain amino acid transport system permease protein n=1 Tax=Desulfovibrio litoralis DSM 11393 TaxID=1121455 RepID=A0A1M7TQL2_9BACT|nr:high-affinity branched-chain amino acid ABC transporter permease LivM [Desulfovibrio litoralis]SHN73022.1 branched-chain amino acid transport system permease protein [Desulfovibrio litoralis DSM 11393]
MSISSNQLPFFHIQNIKRSFFVALWFVFLTLPLLAVKVDTLNQNVVWRPQNMLYVFIGTFVFSFIWRWLFLLKERKPFEGKFVNQIQCFKQNKSIFLALLLMLCFIFPLFSTTYQVNVMVSALLWVILGLGLNIVVGFSGMLVLGYVAFYAIGAYSYALLNIHTGIGFWEALPFGGLFAAVIAIILALPLLRLRGDYLAIVTLGFGEIVRLILENYSDIFYGPSGISNIPKPTLYYPSFVDGSFSFVQVNFTNLTELTNYAYYVALFMTILTIIAVSRLRDSRLGRSWMALREDEIACEAMGINKVGVKLSAFALGAMWAGFGGVLFAAKTSFINPSSFTFMESALILAMVVLGGMGSIFGVVLGSFILILLPEYLRALSEYRMLIFGASMVLMMVFRPQGLVKPARKTYVFKHDLDEKQIVPEMNIPNSLKKGQENAQ